MERPTAAIPSRPRGQTSPALPAIPPAARGRIAELVLSTRRARDLSVASVATAALVAESTVVRAEHGDDVSTEAVRRILVAMGVDPTPHVAGTPSGLVAVPALDDAHAKAMAYLCDAADGEDGWLLFPDLAAEAAALGHDQARLDGLDAAGEASDRREAAWGAGLAGAGGAWLICATFCVISSHPPEMPSIFSAAGWLWSSAFLGLGVALSGGLRMILSGPILGAERRRLGEVARTVSTHRASAFLVGRRGLYHLEATPSGLVRRNYPPSSVRSVTVAEVTDGHVTIKVDTMAGRVELPWVPHVRDVVDLLTSWAQVPTASAAVARTGKVR